MISNVLTKLFFMYLSSQAYSNEIIEKQLTIAMFGDSLIQGYGLNKNEGFVSAMERELRKENYDVKLVNLGVSGDTTSGGVARFDWSISNGVDGIFILLGANDMLRGIPPNVSYRNLKEILVIADLKNLPVFLIGLKATNNYGPDYKEEFDEIYVKLKDEFELYYFEDFFEPLISENNVNTFLSFMQSDNIHPNKEGVARIVASLMPKMKKFVQSLEDQ